MKTKIITKPREATRDSLFLIRDSTQKGFTLIEMLVSVALFSFVMLATTAVLLSVVDANHKAQGLKTSINNLSLALESMARNLRTGSGYPVNGNPSTCLSSITFSDHSNTSTTYSLSANSIQVSKGSSGASPMTAPEIVIDKLCFYVSGTIPGDNIQPRVLITVGGVVSNLTAAGAKMKTTSRFDIETLVSQRLPDVQ